MPKTQKRNQHVFNKIKLDNKHKLKDVIGGIRYDTKLYLI
jgi:hypothetical protein